MPALTQAPVAPPRSRNIRFCEGVLEIDPVNRTACLEGAPLALRAKEFDLLCALAERSGLVASRAWLLAQVWGYTDGMRTRTLDVHISALRRHLAGSALAIETVRGQGYRLRGPGAAVDVTPSTRSRKRSRATK